LYILFSVTDISAVVKALNNADRSFCHLEAGLTDSVYVVMLQGCSQYKHAVTQDAKYCLKWFSCHLWIILWCSVA